MNLSGTIKADKEYIDAVEKLIQKAGELLGTDPAFRNMACIDVALDMLKDLRKEKV